MQVKVHTLCRTSDRAELCSMFRLSCTLASCWTSLSCCSVLLSLSGSVSSSLSRPSSSHLTSSFSLSRLSFTSCASFCVISSFRQYSSDSRRTCWTWNRPIILSGYHVKTYKDPYNDTDAPAYFLMKLCMTLIIFYEVITIKSSN